MEPIQLIIIIFMLIIFAEVSYLVFNAPRRFSVRSQLRPVLLDTSVLIDGRIVHIAKTGFMAGTLIIPRSVIGELQYLADTGDHEKRARARFGLDVVSELQAMPQVDVKVLQDGSKADEGVDDRLLSLAKKHGASICTIDYNLNKVALVEGIVVLNVNELAQVLRMAYLPGEKMKIELVQKGQDSHQAVGYLPDGTMVVVEHANKLIGKAVDVEIIRSLQTAAGRMMFAKMIDSTMQNDSTKVMPARKGQPQSAVLSKSRQPQQTPVRSADIQKAKPRPKRPSANQKKTYGRRGSSDVESSLIELIENS